MKRWSVFCLGLLALVLLPALPARAAVNDFAISSFKIEYDLSKDAANRSTLKTVETITAEFPVFDQNHGLERAIPSAYNGHSTSLTINAVQDQSGASLHYSTYTSNDNLVLRIGDKDRYVHGAQTYVITYTQRDVTNYFADTDTDEFYWDTNGTDWAVPIADLSVVLRIDDGLAAALRPDRACYVGISGASERCQLVAQGNTLSLHATNLQPHENATIAVGFQKNSFAQYKPTATETLVKWIVILNVVLAPVSTLLIIWLVVRWNRLSRRSKDRTTVVPEYLPPKDTSVTMAAGVMDTPRTVFTAQLLDFAVRHYIKIYEAKPKGFLRAAEYEIEVTKDITTLKAEEQELLRDIFGTSASVGERLALKSLRNSTALYYRLQDNDKKFKDLTRGQYGLRARNESQTRFYKQLGLGLLVASVLLLAPVLLPAAIAALIMAYTLYPLTDKGLALAQYLEGLKYYISVAEVDRLKALQSPEGAAKVGSIDPNDSAQLLKLYEKVLPYAVLLGQEKEWNQRIGQLYESSNTAPSWYAGSSPGFNALAFSSAMSGFSTASSYTSASSSSSGGSSGGGSSGGGGGGGGGGGW